MHPSGFSVRGGWRDNNRGVEVPGSPEPRHDDSVSQHHQPPAAPRTHASRAGARKSASSCQRDSETSPHADAAEESSTPSKLLVSFTRFHRHLILPGRDFLRSLDRVLKSDVEIRLTPRDGRASLRRPSHRRMVPCRSGSRRSGGCPVVLPSVGAQFSSVKEGACAEGRAPPWKDM